MFEVFNNKKVFKAKKSKKKYLLSILNQECLLRTNVESFCKAFKILINSHLPHFILKIELKKYFCWPHPRCRLIILVYHFIYPNTAEYLPQANHSWR